jgi:hypothetical protein
MAARFPQRRPGSSGDRRLASHVARTLKGLGGTKGGGFSVRTYQFNAQTIDGERSLTNVIAQRAGSTSEAPILIVAHRDAAGRDSEAELSGTAALLELARVFATRETKRTIVLASTSGGSGGNAGAAELASELHEQFDAAIVLGDLAGASVHRPFVVPFSDGLGSAPLQLQRTVDEAIGQEVDVNAGAPGTFAQLAHLIFPMALGEQAVLNARGVPTVEVQVSGERGPAARDGVSMVRLEGFGRAVLGALDALDSSPNVSPSMQTGLVLSRKTLPMWVLRLLVLTLLLPPLVAAVDGLARARRRRLPAGQWLLWTLSCALPFFSCALLAWVLGLLGVLGQTPSGPVPSAALALNGTAITALVAIVLTFALAWLLWGALVRRVGWGARPAPEVAGLSMMLVAIALALLAWLGNPLTALLAVPAVHLWLLIGSPDAARLGRRSRRIASLALVVIGVLPLALLVLSYAGQLGLGAGELAWTALLLVAGGYVGFFSGLLWSIAFGCVAAATMLAVRATPELPVAQSGEPIQVTIRGPMSYAGPGSLGGTESALRL